MNEAYEAKRKQREEHLKAILCSLFMTYSEEMGHYSAAVKAFEAFRKRMTVGGSVQNAAWLHSLIMDKQNFVPDKDMRKISAEFWQWEEEYYNAQWLAEHSPEWELFVSEATEYYNRLKEGYFERAEMERLIDFGVISDELADFLFRQQTLANITGDFFDMKIAYSYALIGYTYGVRAERARRRGNKKRVPVVRCPRYDHNGHRIREPQD